MRATGQIILSSLHRLFPNTQVGPSTSATRPFFTVIDQFEKGVALTLGKFSSEKMPGIRLRVPLFQQIKKVDMRTRSLLIPPQNIMTSDNVSVHVDAVAFLRVKDAKKAVLEIEDVTKCVVELAQAHLRDELSNSTLESILHRRGEYSEQILKSVADQTADWGVEVQAIKLKNISVDPGMVRALAKQAEAERERQARLITAESEFSAAEKLAEAARTLSLSPGAMRLRELQTYLQMAQENGSTILIPTSLGSWLGAPKSN